MNEEIAAEWKSERKPLEDRATPDALQLKRTITREDARIACPTRRRKSKLSESWL